MTEPMTAAEWAESLQGRSVVIVTTREWVELKAEIERLTADLAHARERINQLERAIQVVIDSPIEARFYTYHNGSDEVDDYGRPRGWYFRSGLIEELAAALASGEKP